MRLGSMNRHPTRGRQSQRTGAHALELGAVASAAGMTPHERLQLLDPLLWRRVGGKEGLDAARVALLLAAQDLEQLDHPAGVPTGAREDLQPRPVRLALVVTAELQEGAVGHRAGG